MQITELPDIDFVDTKAEDIQRMIFQSYTVITGQTLEAAGDPRRLFLLFISDVVIRLLNKLNDTGRMNLIKYARTSYLDNLAALLAVERIPTTAAVTAVAVELSAVRDQETVIPKGTRISPGSNIYFSIDEAIVIPPRATRGIGRATCMEHGIKGNGYLPGEITQIVDPIAYVKAIVNTTTSEGGAEEESDAAFRERIHEAPEKFSVAGPYGAYRYHTMSVNSAIADVDVWSPSPGVVEVIPLLKGGEIPGKELLQEISSYLSDDSIRPLTDQVKIVAPKEVKYELSLKYYIHREADAARMQKTVQEAVTAYVAWQSKQLGRDIVPSKLIQMVQAVPGIKRVDVIAPLYKEIQHNQVAKAETVSAIQAGSEHE